MREPHRIKISSHHQNAWRRLSDACLNMLLCQLGRAILEGWCRGPNRQSLNGSSAASPITNAAGLSLATLESKEFSAKELAGPDF